MLAKVWFASLVWLAAFAAEPYTKLHPLPDFPAGEVRFKTAIVTEGRERIPTGEIAHIYQYYDGAGPEAQELGELSFKMSADGVEVRWGRIDAYAPGKGIGSLLYRQALQSPSFAKVTSIKTSWTEDNYQTYERLKFEGLDKNEAAQGTASAKMFLKQGWVIQKLEDTPDRLSVTYERADRNSTCKFAAIAGQ